MRGVTITRRLHVGQQVQYLWDRDCGPRDEYGNLMPMFGKVYTIRGFVHDRATGRLGVLLVEIVNTPKLCYPDKIVAEMAFHVEAFRTVDTESKKHDSELFESLDTWTAL